MIAILLEDILWTAVESVAESGQSFRLDPVGNAAVRIIGTVPPQDIQQSGRNARFAYQRVLRQITGSQCSKEFLIGYHISRIPPLCD